jgi:hypothetical protein
LSDSRTQHIGSIVKTVGAVLAVVNGALASAMATGHLNGGGAELFSIIFGLRVAVGLIAVGVFIRGNSVANERPGFDNP